MHTRVSHVSRDLSRHVLQKISTSLELVGDAVRHLGGVRLLVLEPLAVGRDRGDLLAGSATITSTSEIHSRDSGYQKMSDERAEHVPDRSMGAQRQ